MLRWEDGRSSFFSKMMRDWWSQWRKGTGSREHKQHSSKGMLAARLVGRWECGLEGWPWGIWTNHNPKAMTNELSLLALLLLIILVKMLHEIKKLPMLGLLVKTHLCNLRAKNSHILLSSKIITRDYQFYSNFVSRNTIANELKGFIASDSTDGINNTGYSKPVIHANQAEVISK